MTPSPYKACHGSAAARGRERSGVGSWLVAVLAMLILTAPLVDSSQNPEAASFVESEEGGQIHTDDEWCPRRLT